MKFLIILVCILSPFLSTAQIDSSFINKIKSLDTANILKTDTLAAPNDALTQKIKSLIKGKSGLTIETILKIKIAEEQQKDTTHSKEFYSALLEDVTSGKTSKLIENSRINLYRRNFTEPEIDELIRFYKTSAGKKMEQEYILQMVQLVKDSEQLLKIAMKSLETTK